MDHWRDCGMLWRFCFRIDTRYVSTQSSQVELFKCFLHQRTIALYWYDAWIGNNSKGKCKSTSSIVSPSIYNKVFWPQSLTSNRFLQHRTLHCPLVIPKLSQHFESLRAPCLTYLLERSCPPWTTLLVDMSQIRSVVYNTLERYINTFCIPEPRSLNLHQHPNFYQSYNPS